MRRNLRLVALILTLLGVFIFGLWLYSNWQPVWECVFAAPADWYGCLIANNAIWEPLTGLILAVAGLLALLADSFAPGGEKSKEYNPTPEERQNNRKELLRRVRSIWIDGYLNQSLYQEVLFPLDMTWDAPDPLPAPYGMKAKRQNQTPLDLVAGSQMATFYGQVNHQLLILGAPGAGKTTVMLDLAKSYLDRAENDTGVPVPVIFTLSSWPGKRTAIEDWLVSEMRVEYGNDITDKVARYWLEHNEIALFLDGLDELPVDRRGDAVAAIETYRNTALGRWFVICSRSAEYGALATGPTALDSVEIKLMTSSQIQRYLAELDGEQPRQLAAMIAGDEILQVAADTPLISPLTLNYMLVAADTIDWSKPLMDQDSDIMQSDIFDAYTEMMLIRLRRGATYPTAKTLQWLQWLARKMADHQRTVFLLERMKSSWFNYPWQRGVWLLVFVVVGGLFGWLVGGTLFGISIGLYAAIGDVRVNEQFRFNLHRRKLLFGLFLGSITGLIFGIVVGQVAGLTAGLLGGLILGVIFALLAGLFEDATQIEQSYLSARPNDGIRKSLRNGIFFGLLAGLTASLVGVLLGNFGGLVGVNILLALLATQEAPIKHYTLRFVLWLDGSMPLNYVRFLDYCADRILLRRVGGGYMFRDIMFRDYFAALTPESIDALAKKVEARKASE